MIISAPPAFYITIVSDALSVTGLRGQAAPVVTGGFGGWTTVPRPRRKALTEWQGIDPLGLTLDLLFDGFDDDTSVEDDCLTLEQLAQPTAPGDEPPVVQVAGIVPHADLDWVINGLTWDATPIYSDSGYRIRQAASVQLLEYVADDRNAAQSAAATARRTAATQATATARAQGSTPSTAGGRTYRVKEGDTLQTIAAHELGSYTRWHEIADLNDIRDPRNITVDQLLRLPR